MTTDEKKEALIGAGVKLRSNASDEKINEEYAEWVADHGPVEPELTPDELEEIEDVNTPIVETSKASAIEEFQRIHDLHATNQGGVRTPFVYEWANKNLPNDLWNEIYAGKRYNGEILKARV